MNNHETVIEHQAGGTPKKRPGWVWTTLASLLLLSLNLAMLPACAQNSAGPPPAASGATPAAVPAQPGSANAEGYFQQGNDLVKQGQLEAAVEAYQNAIELDPNYQAVYANLGVVYYQLEQLDLAAQQYEKALELNPEDGEVTYNLGALNLQRALISGDEPDPQLLAQAVSQLEQALALNPNLAEPYFSLGVAYLAQNDNAKAIEAFQTFIDRDSGSDPRASQEAQRYLDSLTSNN